MTTSTTAENDNQARAATSPTAASTAIESADRERSESRREAVLVRALVALVAAVALFGLAFPELLAPAVAIDPALARPPGARAHLRMRDEHDEPSQDLLGPAAAMSTRYGPTAACCCAAGSAGAPGRDGLHGVVGVLDRRR